MVDLVTALAIIEHAKQDANFSQRYPLAYQRAVITVARHAEDNAKRLNDPNLIEAW